MNEKKLGRFERRLLRSLPENDRTVEEVWKIYKRLYPPAFLQSRLGLTVSFEKVATTLYDLYMLGLVERGSTNYIEEALS